MQQLAASSRRSVIGARLCRNAGHVLFAAASVLLTPSAQAFSIMELLGLDPRSRQQAEARKLDERCKKIVDWAGLINSDALQLQQPNTAQRSARAPAGADFSPALRLFADAQFKPVFGKNFDEFSASERLTIYNEAFVGCQRSPTYAQTMQRITYALGQPFADVVGTAGGIQRPGMLTAVQVAEAVRRMRSAKDDAQKQIAQLQALPVAAASWPQFLTLRTQTEDTFRYLTPADAEAARESVRQIGLRLSAPAIADVLAQAPAETEGTDAMPNLRRAQDALAAIETAAPSADAQSARAQLNERRAAIVRNAVTQERMRFDLLSPTAAGLEPGAQWYGELLRRFVDEEGRRSTEFQALVRDYRARRDQQLADAQQSWLNQLREARSNDEVNRVVTRALPLPDDARSTTGQALRQAASARQEELHKAQILGAQANEKPAAPPPSAAAIAQTAPAAQASGANGEPTAAEMYDVLQARFNRVAAQMKDMQAQCQRGVARSDPMSAMMCLTVSAGNAGGAAEPMRITRFEKLGCAPASGKAGWMCDYILGVSGGSTAALGSMMGAMVGRGNVAQARFLRSSNGWMAIFDEKN